MIVCHDQFVGHFVPGTHCPQTIGVVQTFFTGNWVHGFDGVPPH
jgi:hypothetical protein